MTPTMTGPDTGAPTGTRSRVAVVLYAVIAVALLAMGTGIGMVLSPLGRDRPADESVDAGFARDMTTHHSQAVLMAQIARDRSTSPEVRLLAFDIETGQLAQMGQMRGWLQSWGLSEQSDRPVMAWMTSPHTGMGAMDAMGTAGASPMPGMATTAELDRLRSLTGRDLDVYFLQLMLRHHQGGIPMAREGADRASTSYVRNLADKIATAQAAEVTTIQRMLRTRGGVPLPGPR